MVYTLMKEKKRGANVRVQRNEFFKNRTSIKKKITYINNFNINFIYNVKMDKQEYTKI